jgi:hypothetical protein
MFAGLLKIIQWVLFIIMEYSENEAIFDYSLQHEPAPAEVDQFNIESWNVDFYDNSSSSA